MTIDFGEMTPLKLPDGLAVRKYDDDDYRILKTVIRPGAHISSHRQEDGEYISYIISGSGAALCDGIEETLKPGVVHIWSKGFNQSILNTGDEDLEILTVLVKR